MATVSWADGAIRQLAEIADHIRRFDPAATDRMAERLIRAGESLSTFPNRGRPADGGIREMPGVPPYIIRYCVEDGDVLIIGVRHGARRPKPIDAS